SPPISSLFPYTTLFRSLDAGIRSAGDASPGLADASSLGTTISGLCCFAACSALRLRPRLSERLDLPEPLPLPLPWPLPDSDEPDSTGWSCTRTPRPLQCGHGSLNASSRPVPMRLRVIWTRPSDVT